MKKFTHIGSFAAVVAWVEGLNASTTDEANKIRTSVRYRGTVKLHGTNAGVVCTPDRLIPQSRTQQIGGTSGHAGFVEWLFSSGVEQAIREIEEGVREALGLDTNTPIVLFGEWCGGKIQKKVALQSLPKQFVLFAVAIDEGEELRYVDAVPRLGERYADLNLFSILDAPTWEIEVDFLDREALKEVADYCSRITEEVEAKCPWAARFGVEGVGEGVVWTPTGAHFGREGLYFKTKGDLHKRAKDLRPAAVDPQKVNSIHEFVEYSTTESRLEQGIEIMESEGFPILMENAGRFIKWLHGDIQRECALELAASGLDWKEVNKAISRKAMTFYREATKL